MILPDQVAAVRFLKQGGEGEPVADLVEVFDYQNRSCGSARLRPTADGSFVLPLRLPRGYYELRFAGGECFGVLALEPLAAPDPFFGVDAALSWLERRPAKRTQLVQFMVRCGVAIARDRLHLDHIHSSLDNWTWDRNSNYDELRAAYRQAGLPVLDMLQGAPAYNSAKTFGTPGLPWPQQQPLAARMYAPLLAHYQGTWGGVEIQNEPDFYQRPASYYSVQVKTASYAFAKQGAKVPLIAGVTAFTPPGDWFEGCGQNGLLDDCDAFSFHSYRTAPETEMIISRLRAWMTKYGHERLPLWHSECGWPWPAGPSRADYESDRVSAVEIAAKAVESKACGVARYFPYVLVYQVLGGRNQGMLGQEGSPLRSMAAYAQCLRALSGATYLGDLRGTRPGVRLARVFGRPGDDAATVVLYTGAPGTPVPVEMPCAIRQAAGIDGRAIVSTGRQVVVDDGMCHVRVRRSDIAASLLTATRASSLWALGQSPEPPKRRASPFVLQLVEDSLPSAPSATKYQITRQTASSLSLRVRLSNLSDVAYRAKATLTLPNRGPTFPLAPVTIAPLTSTDLEWQRVDALQSLEISEIRYLRVGIEPLDPGVTRPTDLAVPLVMDGSLEDYLARFTVIRALPILRTDRWTPNLDPIGRSEFETSRGVFAMRVRFAGKGSWAFPRFAVEEADGAPAEGAFLLRARIARSARWVRLSAKADGVDYWKTDLFPADGQWHVVLVPFPEFVAQGAGNGNVRLTGADLRSIQLGMVSNEPENLLELSDLFLVWR